MRRRENQTKECPYCKGRTPNPECKTCCGVGWITEREYNILTFRGFVSIPSNDKEVKE